MSTDEAQISVPDAVIVFGNRRGHQRRQRRLRQAHSEAGEDQTRDDQRQRLDRGASREGGHRDDDECAADPDHRSLAERGAQVAADGGARRE